MVKPANTKIRDDQGRPMTWDMIKQGKKRPTRKVNIPMDDELAAAWQDATGRYDLAKLRLEVGVENDDLRKQLVEEMAAAQVTKDELTEAMEGKVATFIVQGIGRKKYEDLQNEPKFTPTPDQVELNKRRNGVNATLPWNPDTFPPVLFQRCVISPELTLADAKELWTSDDWTSAELLTLLEACINVNEQVRNIDWGKG